ncbi:MAG: hypothetical protein OXF33_12305, partial [Rhodospirillales bacterium]|nr:hypothetical protein [Rhodospirillales bacterium]
MSSKPGLADIFGSPFRRHRAPRPDRLRAVQARKHDGDQQLHRQALVDRAQGLELGHLLLPALFQLFLREERFLVLRGDEVLLPFPLFPGDAQHLEYEGLIRPEVVALEPPEG